MTTLRLSTALLTAALCALPAACTTEVAADAGHDHMVDAPEDGEALPACCEIPGPAEAMAAASAGADGDAPAGVGAGTDEEADSNDDEADRLASFFGAAAEDAGPPPVDDGTGLPDHGLLPEFQLMAEDATSFGRDELLGDVWVVDFIFTRCAGPCPAMSRTFVDMQQEDLPARFLSITVDPAYDSPNVLDQYRRTYGGEADDWTLLTGSHEGIQSLADGGFRLPVNAGTEPVAGMPPMFHSGKFALVDRQGRVRGYYAYTDELGLQQLREDIAKLAALP